MTLFGRDELVDSLKETIALLRSELDAAHGREAELQKTLLALYDARAMAQVHRKPKPEPVPGPRPEPESPGTYDEMRSFEVKKPLSFADIEKSFAIPSGVHPAQ